MLRFSTPSLSPVGIRLFWILIIWLGSSDSSSAQTSMDLTGPARAVALGGATTALVDDLGAHANPATPATFAARAILFFAQEGYGLAELRQAGLHGVQPIGFGTIAGGVSAFGFDDYQELYGSVGWARGFTLGTSRQLYAGAGLRYYRTRIASYGDAQALGLSFGVLVPVLPTLHFGAQLINANGPALAPDAPLAQVLAVGLSYRATERARVLVDLFKDVDFPLSVRGGLEVYPVSHLALRAGAATEPTRFTAGAGLRLGRIRADLAADRHLDLGWTPAVALGMHW